MAENIYRVTCPKKINRKNIVEVAVPGSKSITNRALLLAAMARGTSTLKGCLTSDDAMHFIECLRGLGFPVDMVSEGGLGSTVTLTGFGGDIPKKSAEIYVGSAGTAARFLVALLAFSDGEYTVNASEQMKKRPMQPLIDTLRAAGAEVSCPEQEGHFPLHIKGARNNAQIPDCFTVNIDKSSQFLSALMIAVGTLHKRAQIRVTGSHGLNYVDMTADMMKSFGICVEKETMEQENAVLEGDAEGQCQIRYVFSGMDSYRALTYDVEPDMSAAAYFYALAAVLGVRVSVRGVTSNMLQGDVAFFKVLERMGCKIETLDGTDKASSAEGSNTDFRGASPGNILVSGRNDGHLKGGFCVDMSAFSDQALTLAAIAPFADAPITITGISHIRLQECDRIQAIVHNLSALGVRVEEQKDGVVIYPGTPTGCEIETYDDHRVAMSFALTGLRTEGVVILNPSCCKKTFAQYFEVMEQTLDRLEETSA